MPSSVVVGVNPNKPPFADAFEANAGPFGDPLRRGRSR